MSLNGSIFSLKAVNSKLTDAIWYLIIGFFPAIFVQFFLLVL